MFAIIIGIVTAFNFLILLKKVRMGRHLDAFLDISAMVALSWMFGGTLGGMVVAMVASAVISLSLLKEPLEFNDDEDEDEESSIPMYTPKGATNV